MPRLLFAALLLVALYSPLASNRAEAALSPKPQHWTHIYIGLDGAPLAADMNMKVRDRATQYRFRLDATLPAARGYAASLGDYQRRELSYLRHQGISVRVGRQYHVLFNGFSADVPTAQMPTLRRLQNVRTVVPVRKTYPLLDRSVSLVKAPQAWSVLGGPPSAGRGIRIADIDTGIDMTNPCFKDQGISPPALKPQIDGVNAKLVNNKVIVVRAYGQDASKQFSAVDVQGHGTFTAAIEACDYNTPTPQGPRISGMAPAAYLMVYNIRPDTNGNDTGFSDPDIAAFEAALLDGADVVNYSFGSVLSAGDEREDPYVTAINLATKAGVTFVVAAGNAGPTAQSISSPSTAQEAIAVGATSNSRSIAASVDVSTSVQSPGMSHIRASQGSHRFDSPVGPATLVPVGLGRLPNDDLDNPKADDFAGKDLRGKIALIERGTILFETKINNAQKAGAIGAIIYDNRASLNVFGMDVKSATLPVMAIGQKDGKALLESTKSNPETVATLDPRKISVDETPNVLSDFSSRGYGADYRIKPDLVAPGQDIYSAAETSTPSGELYDKSGFSAADGTSFAAPHVTGGVALILQKYAKATPSMVRALVTESAATAGITDPGETDPPVMHVGAGLMDTEAALHMPAYMLPTSLSLGQVNVGYGATQQVEKVTLTNTGSGAGAWTTTVQPLHSTAGLAVSVPGPVQLNASGTSTFSVQFSEGAATQSGDYDGYIFLHRGNDSIHIPYFVHIANKSVTPGSVLLVDATSGKYQPEPPAAPIVRKDVSKWWEKALSDIGRAYTYWDIGTQGSPSLNDMKKASAVIYFTGANLNGFSHENHNYQALHGPLNSIDTGNLHAYMDGGGKVFVSGEAAALSDPVWAQFVLGVGAASLSEYDNSQNDKAKKGGISPPQPSATVDSRIDIRKNVWAFSGLKPLDFSTKGDGAGDNLAVSSDATPFIFGDTEAMVGVTGLAPWSGSDKFYGSAFGQAALRTTDLSLAAGGADVGIVNSDEPTLKRAAKYRGRSVFFSFNFEGINDNTGYATRADVMKRVMHYLDDQVAARVPASRYGKGHAVQLRAVMTSSVGAKPVMYTWQVGKTTLKSSTKPTSYRFPHTGTFKVRVQVTDSLGHIAVSKWANVTVR